MVSASLKLSNHSSSAKIHISIRNVCLLGLSALILLLELVHLELLASITLGDVVDLVAQVLLD